MRSPTLIAACLLLCVTGTLGHRQLTAQVPARTPAQGVAPPQPPAAGSDGVTAAVAFGQFAQRGHFPYIASLVDASGKWTGCGGTLVRPRLVITAAHCVVDDNLVLKKVKGVKLGQLDRVADSGEYIKAKANGVRFHPSYNPFSLKNDIAFVILEKAAKAKPAFMATAAFRPVPSEWLYVAGWGSTEVAQARDHTKLMMAYIPYQPTSKCNQIMNAVGSGPVSSTHICAGWSSDNADTCGGDSGGPLVRTTKTGDILIGVTSYGPSAQTCGGDKNIGAYTSIMAMRPWIDSIISQNGI